MKLFLLTRTDRIGWDEFISAVVSAESDKEARKIHPSPFVTHCRKGVLYGTDDKGVEYRCGNNSWLTPENTKELKVKYLGETKEPKGVILGSFNAG